MSPEKKVQKLHRKLCSIKNKLAKNPSLEELELIAESLKLQLQDELTQLSDKWRLRSNAKWIEEGEKSTKYFFSLYKIKHGSICCFVIQDSEKDAEQSQDHTFDYIKNSYQKIYKAENININAANQLLNNIPQITTKQNNSLTCVITEEEISQVIDKLPNNKSPEVDGLTYEFYKDTKDLILPVLAKLFNNILEEGHIPNSWSTSLITLIPKKVEDLTKVNN